VRPAGARGGPEVQSVAPRRHTVAPVWSSLGDMPLSSYAKDKFIAPEMSQFSNASIRDMTGVSVEQEHWLSNFILNTIFRVSIDVDVRQTLFNFLRRAQSAFREYSLARDKSLEYLDDTEAVSAYIAAIGHWEIFLSSAYQAYLVLDRNQRSLFQRSDGSVLQRLNHFYNRSKHVETAIERGQLAPDSTMTVWLTNTGLRSVDSEISFDEMADVLEDLARWSDAAHDPLTMREKLLDRFEESAAEDIGTGT
jgi:hypothetical protein